jgi:hypothetical protein
MTEEAREVLELLQNAIVGIDSQFQFWLTISFGMVVAGYLGRDELTRVVRTVLAVLYLLCVAMIVAKTMTYIESGYTLAARLQELSGNQPSEYFAYVRGLRTAVMFLGTVASTVFVLIPSLARRPSSSIDGPDA